MKRLKEALFSENGMRIVNSLFFLSFLFYRSGLVFVAYIAWICYLAFCIKHSEAKGTRIAFGVFIGLAVVMILLNLYFLIAG